MKTFQGMILPLEKEAEFSNANLLVKGGSIAFTFQLRPGMETIRKINQLFQENQTYNP